ncbi:hypothetical protein C8024_10200 [Sphingopyxis sp. BSNA05]|uniref:hypothetical protein n=1 Tax=Sphingopyxis sp. BSNA05 TaxID=1236614 RepID=UPI001563B46F|nr:hypothetical protein [Sphingopyxis sp. BSNA05]NRD89743.1 hypothetical protein [Sphingopyxis sp. BSNA05]
MSRKSTAGGAAAAIRRKMPVEAAVNLLLTLFVPAQVRFIMAMDGLFLFMLLLGATPDRPAVEAAAGPSHVQAVASARILRAEVIDFGGPLDRRDLRGFRRGEDKFGTATIRSTGVAESADGQLIRLQEFH